MRSHRDAACGGVPGLPPRLVEISRGACGAKQGALDPLQTNNNSDDESMPPEPGSRATRSPPPSSRVPVPDNDWQGPQLSRPHDSRSRNPPTAYRPALPSPRGVSCDGAYPQYAVPPSQGSAASEHSAEYSPPPPRAGAC